MNKKTLITKVDLRLIPKQFCWYTIVSAFNHEEVVVQNIKEKIIGTELEPLVHELYIPIKYTKDIAKGKDGKPIYRIHKRKGALSSYVFIKCVLIEEVWNMIRTTAGVSIILSTGGVPAHTSDDKIESLKKQQYMEGFTEEEERKMMEEYKKKYIISEENNDPKYIEEIIAKARTIKGWKGGAINELSIEDS